MCMNILETPEQGSSKQLMMLKKAKDYIKIMIKCSSKKSGVQEIKNKNKKKIQESNKSIILGGRPAFGRPPPRYWGWVDCLILCFPPNKL